MAVAAAGGLEHGQDDQLRRDLVGLERGVVTPVLFSIPVVMARVTTLTATPVSGRVYARSLATAAIQPD